MSRLRGAARLLLVTAQASGTGRRRLVSGTASPVLTMVVLALPTGFVLRIKD
ncbi:hypothetical protein [Rhizobium leguminosarum]|uniref:hypothetical protein n=1 Tax=Rhizobium leguminosarum TaxID=384 RepID=UPI0004B7A500|nr:hypothetical protein [Rhizobium leguminosarum]